MVYVFCLPFHIHSLCLGSLTSMEHVNNSFLCPLASSWIRSLGSTGKRLKKAGIYFAGSLLVGSLKTNERSKLLSGGPLHTACPVSLIPSSPASSGVGVMVSPTAANLGPECYSLCFCYSCLFLLLVTLLNSSQIIFSFPYMSSASCIVLALEPSK